MDKDGNEDIKYLPATIEECFQVLDSILEPEDRSEWLSEDEETAASLAHHTVGRWVRNNFGLWRQEENDNIPIVKYFESLNIQHPDDMSSIILAAYYKKHNNMEYCVEELAKPYIEFWEQTYKELEEEYQIKKK